MARDLHILNDMLSEAKELIEMNQLTQARSLLVEMRLFFENAELDGVPSDLAMDMMSEREDLLAKYFPDEFSEQAEIAPKTFWQRLFGK